jgi:hypothetical protein
MPSFSLPHVTHLTHLTHVLEASATSITAARREIGELQSQLKKEGIFFMVVPNASDYKDSEVEVNP